MKKNNLLKKPFVLTLMFILILSGVTYLYDFLRALLKVIPGDVYVPLAWALAALIVGMIYTKINKEPLLKNQKIKIAIYSTAILLFLFLLIMAFMVNLFSATPFHLIVMVLTLILPTLLIILAGICIYPSLELGCQWSSSNKSKLKNCLIIIFCFFLAIFFYKYNDSALNAMKPTVIKYMVEKGYIRKTPSIKIESAVWDYYPTAKNSYKILLPTIGAIFFSSKMGKMR